MDRGESALMVVFVIALIAATLIAWLALHVELIPWRRSATAHWSVRARALVTVRVAAALNLWFVPLACVLIVQARGSGNWVGAAMGGLLGATLAGYLVDQEVAPEVSGRTWLHLAVVRLVLRLLRWVTFVAAIYFMPATFNFVAWAIPLGFLITVLALEYGLGLHLLRWAGVLQRASPRLLRVVAEAREPGAVAPRAVWELNSPEANALAVTTTHELVFTRRLLAGTNDHELRAICAHELAHLAESRWTLIGRIAGSLAVFPILFFRPVEAKFGPQGVLLLVMSSAAMVWLRSRLSQVMEKHADRAAVAGATDSSAYARGLETIYRLNRMPVVQRKSSLNTHPDLYDRMVTAGVAPDYPRPKPPRGWAWSSTLIGALCAWLLLRLLLQR